ncbi:MAG: CARDB domain-containing protein [candidate division KSB1 bacterium]|jgi:hypothetical protein|nr:CARDB domain-containing protein [candidate division KSB1 bacterium]
MRVVLTFLFSLCLSIQSLYANEIVRPLFSPVSEDLIFSGPKYNGLYLYLANDNRLLRICDTPGAGYDAGWSPDGSKIAFKYIVNNEGGSYQIPAIYDMATGSLHYLTDALPHTGVPAVTADNDIAYTIGDKLHISSESGRVKRTIQLPHYVNQAPISADGKQVVYNDPSDQLWIVTLESGNHRPVSSDSIGLFAPQWSPDGTKILARTLASRIMVFDLNTGNAYDIDEGSAPSWIPDSEHIVYCRERRDEAYEIVSSEIYKSRYDGNYQVRLIDNDFMNGQPHVSHGKLIYTAMDSDRLFLADIDTESFGTSVPEMLHIDTDKAIQVKYQTPEPGLSRSEQTFTVLDAPYIHQVYDTPDWFLAGHSACGATAAMMGIAYYKVLPEWPCTCSYPYSHKSDYGRYISDTYSFNGYTYNIRGYNSRGNYGYGGFGFIVQNNWANTKEYMALYLRQHKIGSSVDWNPTLTKIDNELSSDRPFVVLTSITTSGHYQLVVGHDPGSHSIVVNDPYGNDNQGYMNYNGKKVTYDWPGYNNGHANLNTVWCYIYMKYHIPDLTLDAFSLPDTVSAGETVSVDLSLSNTGSSAAENINVGFYLSTNAFFDHRDPLIHSTVIDRIDVDEYLSETIDVVIPDTMLSRRYGLGVRIDDGDQIDELAETNNLEYDTFIIKGCPEIYSAKPEHMSTQETGTPTISAKYRDNVLGIALSTITLMVNDQDVTALSEVSNNGITYISDAALRSGKYTAILLVGNADGHVNRKEWSFYIQTTRVAENNPDFQTPTNTLFQNYPNPFNAETRITYQLKESAHVSLTIYALDGKRVRRLYNGAARAGSHHHVWDSRDDAGRPVSSGIYYYQLSTNNFKETKRLVLIK